MTCVVHTELKCIQFETKEPWHPNHSAEEKKLTQRSVRKKWEMEGKTKKKEQGCGLVVSTTVKANVSQDKEEEEGA